MESSKETLIIKEIAHQLSPDCKELLFGSKAMDESNTNSDYDIELIIIDKIDMIEEYKEKKEYKSKSRKIDANYNLMTDVFIESEEEMQEKGILMEHIYRTALDEGMFE